MRKIVAIFFVLISTVKLNAQQTWKLAKDKDGIKIYTGKVLDSDYYGFKAIMSVKSSEQEIIEILKDVKKYPEWFAFTASTKLIAQSGNEQSFFMETDYPFPFSNECMNYRMVLDKYQDNKTKISITGTNPDLHCDYTMKKASGYITLEPDNGNIIVTYYFHSEPSQNIPTWLINPKIHEMPFQTFKGLRKRLKI